MSRAILIALVAIATISAVVAQTLPTQDLVNINSSSYFPPGNYNFSVYSGYLQTNSQTEALRKLHYVFVTSQNDWQNDPVLLWLNGGPGCSSLDGFIYEHGPWVLQTNDSKLVWNNNSWNRNASVLYIESPINVGLSVGPSSWTLNDTFTAQDNARAVAAFFQKFPVFKSNNFYVSGESYGGIYVPSLAQAIHFYNQGVTSDLKINLKGFAVGNGVVLNSNDEVTINFFRFFERHTLLAPQVVTSFYENNCQFNPDSLKCSLIINNAMAATNLPNLNPYYIYGMCYDESADVLPPSLAQEVKANPEKFQRKFELNKNPGAPAANPFANLPPCADVYGATVIFNDATWRKAFNIDANAPLWTLCSNTLQYDQQNGAFSNMSDTYNFMLEQGYDIMYYSGDADTMCSIDNARTFFSHLVDNYGLTNTVPKTQWTQPGNFADEPQVGGFYETFNGNSNANFHFVQVMGVGHMVPQWNRPGGYKLITAFIHGQMNNLD